MRSCAILIGVMCACAETASAQSAAPSRGYVEAVAQSAFGNVTSQSFGGELGIAVHPGVQVFFDAGLVRDAAPSSLGANAQRVAIGVAALAGAADFRVKEPVSFGVVGVKVVVPTSSRVEPYLLAGGGVARVSRDVSFTVPSGDVTQFATVGKDLSGDETKPMISIGGGVGVPVFRSMMLDFQYRFGRVATSGEALNVNRAGIGIGVRF